MIRPGEYDSIIVMYNSIFMPALKTALLKFLPEKEVRIAIVSVSLIIIKDFFYV